MIYSIYALRYGAFVDAMAACAELYPCALLDFWLRVWSVRHDVAV